jgi:tellurite resistance protein
MSEPATNRPPVPIVPAAFFGMVLGIGGLGGAWRVAARTWGLPAWIGDALMLAAALIWCAWIALYIAKWVWAPGAARAELADPALSFGLGLVAMATLMASIAIRDYAPGVAWWIFTAGAIGGTLLAAWLIGGLWQGGRGLETVTPLMILPAVGTAYTGALAASAFGYRELAATMWGPGVVTWLIMDSLILYRLMSHGLPVPMRASIGIQLAPPAVGCLAYLGFTEGPPDRLVHFLIGYAILQGLILIRLAPWIRAQPFSPGAWAFTFGVAAMSGSTLICLQRHPAGVLASLAWPMFVFANLFIGWIAVRTIMLAVQGRLFPQPAPVKPG